MPTINDLGQKVKAKYPGQYDDLSDSDVGAKVKAKFPGAYDDFTDTVAPAVVAPQIGFGEKVLRGVSGLAVGAGKGIAETAAQLSSAGEKVLQAPIKAFGGQVSKPFGEEVIESGALEAQGGAEKFGKGVERVAEFIVPIGAVGRGVKAVETATGLLRAGKAAPGIGKAIGRLGVRSAAEGLSTAGVTAAQGGDTGEVKSAGVIGAASVPAFGAVGKVAGGVGKLAAQALGKSTGAGEAAIKEAFSNPSVVKYARQGTDAISSLQEQALEGAKKGLSNMAKKRGADYVKALEKIKTDPTSMREIADNARMKAQEFLAEAGVRVGKGKMLPANAFRDSAIEQGKNAVTKAYRTLSTWTDYSAGGLDKLKKKLNQFKNSVRNTTDGSYAAIKSMSGAVDDGLKGYVPGYREMTSKYAEASDVLDEIEKALSLKDSVSRDTAIRKFMSTMRQGNEMRLEFLRELGVKGGGDIVGKIAGSTLSPAMPRGLSGSFSAPVSLGAITTGNIPGYLMYLAATSPRLVAEAVSVLSKTSGKLLTEETKKALQAIILQAQREDGNGETTPQ